MGSGPRSAEPSVTAAVTPRGSDAGGLAVAVTAVTVAVTVVAGTVTGRQPGVWVRRRGSVRVDAVYIGTWRRCRRGGGRSRERRATSRSVPATAVGSAATDVTGSPGHQLGRSPGHRGSPAGRLRGAAPTSTPSDGGKARTQQPQPPCL